MIDTTILAAMAVGFVSFISPCVLPLVPGYLSTVSGVAVADFEGDHRIGLRRVLAPALIFCFSFTVMFIALGAVATSLGSLLQDHRSLLNKLAGVAIVAMGVFFITAPFIGRLNREWHPHALLQQARKGGPFIAGLAFAVAWTPCIGPTLAAVLATASTKSTVGDGILLLSAYSAGLAIPFLVTAVAFTSTTRFFGWFRRHYLLMTALAGAVLIVMGILIYTNELFRLNAEAQKLMDSLGINIFKGL